MNLAMSSCSLFYLFAITIFLFAAVQGFSSTTNFNNPRNILLLPSKSYSSYYIHHHLMLRSTLESSTENTILTVEDATAFLQEYDQAQQAYLQQTSSLLKPTLNPGLQTLDFCQNYVSKQMLQTLRQSVKILVSHANYIRNHPTSTRTSGAGRVMLGICAQHVTEGILGLKSFVSTLQLPRGLLHGMDVDGVPIPEEELGSVYIKYNTGGCQTFTELRQSGLGLEALWKPGDAFLERYEGDFRGVYLNVELDDGVFRQFGVLPTNLFFPDDEDDGW